METSYGDMYVLFLRPPKPNYARCAVQADLNQINEFFLKYPHFSSSKLLFFTLKPQNFKDFLINSVCNTALIIKSKKPSISRVKM